MVACGHDSSMWELRRQVWDVQTFELDISLFRRNCAWQPFYKRKPNWPSHLVSTIFQAHVQAFKSSTQKSLLQSMMQGRVAFVSLYWLKKLNWRWALLQVMVTRVHIFENYRTRYENCINLFQLTTSFVPPSWCSWSWSSQSLAWDNHAMSQYLRLSLVTE